MSPSGPGAAVALAGPLAHASSQPVLPWVDVSEARCVTISSAWNLGSACVGTFLVSV